MYGDIKTSWFPEDTEIMSIILNGDMQIQEIIAITTIFDCKLNRRVERIDISDKLIKLATATSRVLSSYV